MEINEDEIKKLIIHPKEVQNPHKSSYYKFERMKNNILCNWRDVWYNIKEAAFDIDIYVPREETFRTDELIVGGWNEFREQREKYRESDPVYLKLKKIYNDEPKGKCSKFQTVYAYVDCLMHGRKMKKNLYDLLERLPENELRNRIKKNKVIEKDIDSLPYRSLFDPKNNKRLYKALSKSNNRWEQTGLLKKIFNKP